VNNTEILQKQTILHSTIDFATVSTLYDWFCYCF